MHIFLKCFCWCTKFQVSYPPPPPPSIDHSVIHWKKYGDSWEQKLIKKKKRIHVNIFPLMLKTACSPSIIWKRKGAQNEDKNTINVFYEKTISHKIIK